MPVPHVSAPIPAILGAYWRADRATLALVAGVVLASSVAGIAAPYVFSRLIDRLGSAPPASALLAPFLAYAALLGLAAALQRIVSYLSFMTSENLSFIAGAQFFARIFRKTPAFFVEHNPAQIQDAAEKGRQGLSSIMQLGLMVVVPGVAQIVLALATLGVAVDPGIAALVLAYGAAYVALARMANRRTQPFLEAATEGDQANARLIGNAMQAMETLRHFGAGARALGRFEARARAVRESWRAFCLRHAAYGALFGAGLGVQVAIAFALLVPRLRAGEVSVGDVVLFNALLLQLNRPFEMIGHAIDDIARARAELRPMAEMWDAPAEAEDGPAGPVAMPQGRIAFEGVSHLYDNGRGVRDASFTAERGRMTFLTGETGSGKSTLLRIALKSLAPTRGRVLVDGIDLAGIGRADWAACAAVVPQDVVLLNDSLEENILLGRPKDPARLRRAAREAAILELIEALPEGFAARVGERGLKLSGGERQRIAIARALYADPTALFLDEASSALDEATEREILAHLRGLADRVTIIAITHRLGVIAPGDRVVELPGAARAEGPAAAGTAGGCATGFATGAGVNGA